MIWIATLFLLAVAAWLFFNALNEQRWVEAHSHDETVAADKGILPDLSGMSARLRGDTDGKTSIDQENTPFARAVATVREKSAKAGERIERFAAEARDRDDGNTLFGRAVAKVGSGVGNLDAKLDARAKRAAEGRSSSVTEESTLLGRTTAGVARRQEQVGAYVRERVARAARTDQRGRPAAEEEGFFGRTVKRVSGRLDAVEGKLDARAERARTADDDLLTRTSAKVGGRINEIDDRVVDKSKDVANRVDKKTDL